MGSRKSPVCGKIVFVSEEEGQLVLVAEGGAVFSLPEAVVPALAPAEVACRVALELEAVVGLVVLDLEAVLDLAVVGLTVLDLAAVILAVPFPAK